MIITSRRLVVTTLVIAVWGFGTATQASATGSGDHGTGGSGHKGHRDSIVQTSSGKRYVSAPAANSPVTFTGVQQVSVVGINTNTQNAFCKKKRGHICKINQNMWSRERN
ncbi:hypothetical protein [Microbispora sp. NPDC049125]|uniref:hypothetical protein n=1 Tax=Microbispora sp. NPDC049125 TaxID=3154929 RepID=UPI0034670A5A